MPESPLLEAEDGGAIPLSSEATGNGTLAVTAGTELQVWEAPQGEPQALVPCGGAVQPGASAASPLFTPEQARQLEDIQRQAPQLYPSAPRLLPPLPGREQAMDPIGASNRPGKGMTAWATDGLQLGDRPGKGMTAWTSNGLHALDRPDSGVTAALEEMHQLRWQMEYERAQMSRMVSQMQEENLMLRVQLAEEREHRFSTPEEGSKPAAEKDGEMPHAEMQDGASMVAEDVEEQPAQHDAEPELVEDVSRVKTSQERSMEIMLKIMQGMQTMQQQILDQQSSGKRGTSEDHREDEYVRGSVELHKLAEWSPESAPVDFQDWLLVLQPQMADLSASSSHGLVQEASGDGAVGALAAQGEGSERPSGPGWRRGRALCYFSTPPRRARKRTSSPHDP